MRAALAYGMAAGHGIRPLPAAAPYVPSNYVGTPSYEGSNQVTEPCVRYFPTGWNGFKFWMCMVPIPGGNVDYENPSILCSNNGTDWSVPVGLVNPLHPKPASGNNEDGALYHHSDTNTMYCLWNVNDLSVPANNGVWYRTSTDGVAWTAATQMLSGPRAASIEPKIVRVSSNLYRLYLLDSAIPKMTYREGASPTGPWGALQQITITIPNGLSIWHYDVIRDTNGRYVLAFCDDAVKRNCWLASSWDGITWVCATRPFLPGGAQQWCDTTYRPTVQQLGATHYGCWFGGIFGQVWRVGYTTIPASEIPA